MPATHRTTILCRYRYDPLDRLVASLPDRQASIQWFYCRSRLATEIRGSVQRSIFQHAEHLLAQQQYHDAKVDSHLLATDTQRSVLTALDGEVAQQFAYSPYGHRPSEHDAASLPGFNGERLDHLTGHYHLGNGYRQYNPVLMRFNSPDGWSPFGKGGLNAYAYCEGDPRNWFDETGHGRIPNANAPAPKRPATKAGLRSKAIVKPLAANPEGSGIVNSSRKWVKRPRTGTDYNRDYAANYYEERKAEAAAIDLNEAARVPDGSYTFNTPMRSFRDTEVAFKIAQEKYGFDRYPDKTKVRTWMDPEGDFIVDTTHFDIARFHSQKLRDRAMESSFTVFKLIKDRAEYLRRFAGVDLMVIRNP